MTQTASTATEKNASKKDVQRMAEEKFSDRSPLLKRTKAAPGTIKRLFGYIFKFKIQVAIVVVCILVSAAAQAGSALFLQSLIDDYILPIVGLDNPDWAPLIQVLTTMACLYAVGTFCSWLTQWLLVNVEQGVLKEIRDEMFAHQQLLPIKYFDTHEHGDIMSRYTNDTDTLRQAISQSFPQMFQSSISALAALVSMLWLSVPVTLFVLAFSVLLFGVVRVIVGRSGRFFLKQQQSLGEVNAFVEESVNGQKVIKVFNTSRPPPPRSTPRTRSCSMPAPRPTSTATSRCRWSTTWAICCTSCWPWSAARWRWPAVGNFGLSGTGDLTVGALISLLTLAGRSPTRSAKSPSSSTWS